MGLTVLDYIVLAGYFAAMALMGVYFSKRNKNTEEYFVGGRSFAGWVIGLSLVGTSISSVTFLAFPADAFKTAWLRYLPSLGLLVAVAVAAVFVLPIYRRLRLTTAYEYLEHRFGPSVRVYGAVAFVIGQLLRLSIILYLVSLLVHEMTGWNLTFCIIGCGVFVAFYTIVGGIDAVIWTDVIQTVVLALGGVICVCVIIHQLPGGLGQIFSVALADHKLAIADMQPDGTLQPVGWGLSLSSKTGTMLLIYGIVGFLTEYMSNQNVVQRYAASKSTREARKAMIVCAGASVPIWAFYMFLGTSLYVFFKVFPVDAASEMLSGVRKAEQVLPFFIIHYLPPGVTGLVIAAAVAAAMSSLDSSINSISAVGVTDLYRRYFAKGKSDGHFMRAAWSMAVVTSVLMIVGAIVLAKTETKTLQDAATIVGSLLGAGLLGMYILGFFTRHGDARSVWVGILFTVIFTAWTVVADRCPDLLPEALAIPFDLYYTGIIGNILMFVTGYLLSLLLPRKKRERLDELTVWGAR
ncbi:sodium:solute symporter [Tichowtungia aerotolerans]|uniref:Sodium/solute symporter n=1 Tax=Tichowtungia aerotolerans TaxID=2697043 RepID=A0A6P1M8N1_9BACT|nr:sodium:solute symporter [Tichowtungia aerotolerans]QHI69423.1 sodium/solute symporter [Tichowtungia aerotolerans]